VLLYVFFAEGGKEGLDPIVARGQEESDGFWGKEGATTSGEKGEFTHRAKKKETGGAQTPWKKRKKRTEGIPRKKGTRVIEKLWPSAGGESRDKSHGQKTKRSAAF